MSAIQRFRNLSSNSSLNHLLFNHHSIRHPFQFNIRSIFTKIKNISEFEIHSSVIIKHHPRIINKRSLITINKSTKHETYHQLTLKRNFAIIVHNQPDVGEGTVEVDILEWYVKIGDKVKSLQIIGKGKYEKADVDIYSPYTGIVHQIIIEAKNIARVGEPLIAFEVEGIPESAEIQHSIPETKTAVTPVSNTHSTSKNSIQTLPAVRRMAAENGIDLALIHGTGKDGRILKEDVLNYQQNKTSVEQTSKPMAIRISQPLGSGDYVESIIGVPRAMVNKMKEAVDVPIFGYGEEIILNNLVKLKPEMQRISSQYDIRVGYMSFFIKATSMALLSPNARILNAHVNKECTEINYKSDHNIGIAIDTADGLVVANIKQCQLKSILEIAESLQILVEKARNSSLTTDDISGGTITLSNVGAIGGGTYCHPICFVPEVCIAAFGAMKEYPRYDSNGEIFKAQVMAVQWSADHRVVDGATMARFCNEWKDFLENPQNMMIHMR